MDRRAFKNFITKRSSIWTLSLCMTGIIVLGGIAAVDQARRDDDVQQESELGQVAYLEEELTEQAEDINDTLLSSLDEEEAESADMAEVSGSAVAESVDQVTDPAAEPSAAAGEDAATQDSQDTPENTVEAGTLAEAGTDEAAAEAASGQVISEQALIDQGISFTEEEALLWPSAGTILIDYSMDGSVYFPTLNQYKYNPALIIGSDTGNQVLASAKGIVESIGIDDETGNTLVLNIGNGYKLTYGQLKEIPVTEGSVVEAGAVLGYVSEPTKYYTQEGSNLYFKMTQNDAAVDPVLYLE